MIYNYIKLFYIKINHTNEKKSFKSCLKSTKCTFNQQITDFY